MPLQMFRQLESKINYRIHAVIVQVISLLMFGGFFLICILIEIQPESSAMPSIKLHKFDLKTNECRLRKKYLFIFDASSKKLETKMQFAYHRFYNTSIKRVPVEFQGVFNN